MNDAGSYTDEEEIILEKLMDALDLDEATDSVLDYDGELSTEEIRQHLLSLGFSEDEDFTKFCNKK